MSGLGGRREYEDVEVDDVGLTDGFVHVQQQRLSAGLGSSW